jgi:hypothetical protein
MKIPSLQAHSGSLYIGFHEDWARWIGQCSAFGSFRRLGAVYLPCQTWFCQVADQRSRDVPGVPELRVRIGVPEVEFACFTWNISHVQ